MACYPRRICFSLLLLLLLVGGALRLWALPARYDIRDGDERDYLAGGLDVFQGMPPTLHYAPAGVEAWWGWLHAATLSGKYVFRPTGEEWEIPAQLRPFVAINHALFDLYRDMSGMRLEYDLLQIGVGLCAVIAGFRLGMRWAGLHGAVLVGGLLAVVPLLIELGALAKPYSMAWSFAVIAFYFAGRKNPRPITSAIFLALAIGSRIEMLMVLPLCWLLLWPVQPRLGRFVRNVVRYTFATAVATLLIAPWLLPNLMGNLRAIATIRFAPPVNNNGDAWDNIHEIAFDIGVHQGMAIMLAILAVGLLTTPFVMPASRRAAEAQAPDQPPAPPAFPGKFWSWLVLAFGAALVMEMFHDTGYGLRHHGPAMIGVLCIAGLAVAPLAAYWPRATWGIIAAALLFPLVQTARADWKYHHAYVADDATNWIDAHVPAGTTLYLYPTLNDPLPTPASADAAWDEVMRRDAAPRKFQAAARRFNLANFEPPRALADQNMMTERGGMRRFYVLGGRSQIAGPRFNIQYTNSSVFGVIRDVRVETFKRSGGVLLWRECNDGAPPPDLAPLLIKSWTAPGRLGTYIYVSPDIRSKLAHQDA